MLFATVASVDVDVNEVIGSAPIKIKARDAISISELATDGMFG
jgi:hypothetical protein